MPDSDKVAYLQSLGVDTSKAGGSDKNKKLGPTNKTGKSDSKSSTSSTSETESANASETESVNASAKTSPNAPISAAASTASTSASDNSAGTNPWLDGPDYNEILSAVEQILTQLTKQESQTDAQVYLSDMAAGWDMTKEEANLTLQAGQAQADGDYAKAICCGVGAAISLGSCGATAAIPSKNLKMTQMLSSFSQGMQSVGGSDSVASNIASGYTTEETAKMNAMITMLKFIEQYIQQTAQNLNSDRNNAQSDLTSALQSLTQAQAAMFQFVQRG